MRAVGHGLPDKSSFIDVFYPGASLFNLVIFFSLTEALQVGTWNRYNVANWRYNLETVHILAILRCFLLF